jgi:hypothetical protein
MDKLPWSDSQQGYMEIEDWVDGIDGFDDWGVGRPARQHPAAPVEIRAVPHDGYTGLPDEFHDHSVPLMSRRLKEALDAAGVDNVIYLPVTLRNPDTGQTYEYYAFNLVGLVAATDLAQSNIASPDGDFVGDSQIHDLVIDESKCKGFLMFRLKEKFSAVFVHRRVKDTIESRGITTMKFTKPEDYMHL